MKNESFITMVKEDIEKCDEALNLHSFDNASALVNDLFGKYSKVSANFPKIETNPLLARNYRQMPLDNIRIIRGFLTAC